MEEYSTIILNLSLLKEAITNKIRADFYNRPYINHLLRSNISNNYSPLILMKCLNPPSKLKLNRLIDFLEKIHSRKLLIKLNYSILQRGKDSNKRFTSLVSIESKIFKLSSKIQIKNYNKKVLILKSLTAKQVS